MAAVFVGSEAVSAGQLTRHELQRFYRPIFRGVYLPKSAEPTLRDRTVAAWLASGRRGVVAGLADRYPKVRGMRQLRELLPLIDAGAGLPRAQAQVPVFDGYTPIAFLDIGWPQYLVAVEYDGDHHRRDRRQYVKDLARLRMLEERGWIVIRVIAEESPGAWIARTTAALRSRGCHIEIDEMQRSTRPFAA
ncbi:cullin, a subunit of E3 ubiquitin ligase [Mycobacteroides abscessus subsp. abscessus]|uniref:hypothetical protein n=1 Tax=Mycobacteroides abscessus TaxID=36809 RepID=UPI000925CA87|nr:hypothetical protein [Mycobacteroides abscessus]SHR19294.1 cullin, a subunit of E3 ubiquitin ligase [Mycobacteroides abscessus subsp. abscessus]